MQSEDNKNCCLYICNKGRLATQTDNTAP